MRLRYEAKHFKEESKLNSLIKFLIAIIMLVVFAFSSISGILSYSISQDTAINKFSIAGIYTIHYDANGGTGTMADQYVFVNVATNLTANSFTRNGHSFDGWNTAADGNGTDYTDGASVTNLAASGSSITLYAKWEAGDYNITYNLNGGTVATSNPTTYNEETETFTLNNPTKVGYTFKGWSGTGLTGDENTTVTIPQGSTGDRTYTANYIPNTYYIRFNANGGTGTMSNQEMTYGTTANLTANSFENPAYVFTEWTTQADGTGTHYQDEQSVRNLTTINGAIIDLYAQWEDERYVAEVVGDKKYSSLQAAINAVSADGVQKTIKLLKNTVITKELTVGTGKNIVFDFQSFTVSNDVSKDINIIKNTGTIEIVRGTIQTSALTKAAIDNDSPGSLVVSGGNIISTGERQAIYNNGGTVEVTGDAYLYSSAPDRATIENHKPDKTSAGTITISGGEIISAGVTTRGAVQNDATGTAIITGGTIISNNSTGVDNHGTLIIGEEDENVDITSPVIQGATYGVTASNTAPVEFYDGIVKGQTDAFNDKNYITDQEDGYDIRESTEEIDGDTYHTAYLHTAKIQVRFNANNGTTEEPVRLVDNNTAIGQLPTATRPRHSFNGWFTEPTGGRQINASEVITAPITYYAQWTQTEVLVKFDANGGSPAETTEIVNVGSTVQSLPATPTKTGSAFVGWFTDPTGGTQIDGTEIITQDTTYYAHWEAMTNRVTFDPNLGTVDEPTRDVPLGSAVGQLPVPTRTDYGFAGWFTDPDGGTRVTGNEIITEPVTFYAHWINNYVAQIGDIKYETLQAAVNDVPNNTETTILLLADSLEAVDVAANKNIVLDLQNHTLSNDGTKVVGQEQVVMRNLGTITITNGTLAGETNSATINNELNGRLIIIGANIIQTGVGNKRNKQAIYNNGGTVEISGSTYISAKNSGSYGGNERGAIQNLKNGSHVGTIIITGGTIESLTGPGIVNQADTILTIGAEDGTASSTTPVIQGLTYGVINKSNAVFNFYDGIVKGKTNAVSGTITDYEDGATEVNSTDANSYHIKYYE